MEQLAEPVVTRHAALAVAQNVDRRKVDELLQCCAVAATHLAHPVWKVLQCDGAGIVHAECVNDVDQLSSATQGIVHGVRADDEIRVVEVIRGEFQDAAGPVVLGETNLDLVRQEGVQAVDRDEFLGQAIVRAGLIGRRAWNAADRFASADASKVFLHILPGQSPPIRIHADLQGWVSKDSRRPVDGVNFGHKCVVDHARDTENLSVLLWVVLPLRKGLQKVVADGVMFEREQVVHQT